VQIPELQAALDKMSFAELKVIAPMVAAKIVEREKSERNSVKAELAESVKSIGFEMDDLFGNGAKPAKEKKTVPPKYPQPGGRFADLNRAWT